MGNNKSRLEEHESVDANPDTVNDLFDTSRNNSVEQRRIQTQGGMGYGRVDDILKFNS